MVSPERPSSNLVLREKRKKVQDSKPQAKAVISAEALMPKFVVIVQ